MNPRPPRAQFGPPPPFHPASRLSNRPPKPQPPIPPPHQRQHHRLRIITLPRHHPPRQQPHAPPLDPRPLHTPHQILRLAQLHPLFQHQPRGLLGEEIPRRPRLADPSLRVEHDGPREGFQFCWRWREGFEAAFEADEEVVGVWGGGGEGGVGAIVGAEAGGSGG